MVNSLRIGLSRYHQIFGTPDVGENPDDYSYNGSTYHFYTGQTDPTFGGFPRIQINGFPSFQLGGPVSWPKSVGPDSVYQFNDSVSIQRGKHAIKFGGEILLNRSDDNVTSNNKGPVAFRSLDDFFTGTIKTARITSGDTARSLSDEGYALFIQDDWRIDAEAHSESGPAVRVNHRGAGEPDLLGNFLPGQGIYQAGSTQLPNVMNGDHKDFAPRVGFAWDIFGNGRTVLRGGAGVYYSQASFDAFMAVANLYGLRTIPTGVPLYANGNPTPTTAGGKINVATITYSGSSLGSPTTPGSIAYGWANNSSTTPLYSLSSACGDGTVTLATGFTPQPCSILGVDPNLKTPYVATYNLGIQHALTRSLSLEATYVGNDAQRLFGVTDLNQPQTVGGFSAGWGNPANPNSAAGQCLASASSGYNNCAPNGGGRSCRPALQQQVPLSELHRLPAEQQYLQLQRPSGFLDAAAVARPVLRARLHLRPRPRRKLRQLELHRSHQQQQPKIHLWRQHVRHTAPFHRIGDLPASRENRLRASSSTAGPSTPSSCCKAARRGPSTTSLPTSAEPTKSITPSAPTASSGISSATPATSRPGNRSTTPTAAPTASAPPAFRISRAPAIRLVWPKPLQWDRWPWHRSPTSVATPTVSRF